MNKNIRRVYLINPKFQLEVIAWMVAMSLAPITAFFVAHYYFFWKLKEIGRDIKLEPEHIYFRFIDGQSEQLFLIFIVCSVVAMLIVVILGLSLSHKIAGPIQRLKVHMKALTRGEDLPELKFRKNDYFQEVPPIINDYIEKKSVKK